MAWQLAWNSLKNEFRVLRNFPVTILPVPSMTIWSQPILPTCSHPNIQKSREACGVSWSYCVLHTPVILCGLQPMPDVFLSIWPTLHSTFKNMLQYHICCGISTDCLTPSRRICLRVPPVPECLGSYVYYNTHSVKLLSTCSFTEQQL